MKRYCYNCMKLLSEGKCGFCGYTFKAPPAHHLLQGTVLNNRYLIGNAIGEGGFGITYIGRDINLDMTVAVKEFYPKGFVNRNNLSSNMVEVNGKSNLEFFEKGRKKLIREARVLAKFSGTNSIVDVRDYFEENNTGYIVMEYIQGETLKRCVEKYGAFSSEEIICKMMPLFYALEKVHSEGLIHRDISPDNIMIVNDGSMKLMDFGATRDVNFITEHTMSVVLKLGYAPEEQYRAKGVQGPWTDIYAICATIYKCITCITPEDSLERAFSDKLRRPSELGADISPELEEVILKGMSPHPEERYQNMNEFIEAVVSAGPREHEKSDADEYDDNDSTLYYTEDESNAQSLEPKNEINYKNKKGFRIPRWLIVSVVLMIIGGIFTSFIVNERNSYTKIPKVYSLSERAAENVLEDNELECKIDYEYSDKLSKGKVIKQQPEAGESVKKNSIITVTVSSGRLVSVPDIKGLSYNKAKKLVEKASLKLTAERKAYSATVEESSVISQSPKARSVLAEGKAVTVIISKGKKPITVPNLFGMSLKKAKAKAKGFTIKVKRKYSEKEKNTVISQSIKAGEKVRTDTRLIITVSKGAKPAETEPATEATPYYEQYYEPEIPEPTEAPATEPQTLGELKFDD